MPASFQTHGTFEIASRHWFVIHGDVLSGAVRPGMTVHVRLNGTLAVSERIHGVEFVDFVRPRRGEIALVIKYEDIEELAVWQALNIKDEVLEITD